MHQILSLPFEGPNDEIYLIEQTPAPILFLTSASTDISTISSCLRLTQYERYACQIRALQLSYLNHPAQIDHYLNNTASNSSIIILRLLGGIGHWSYGIEQLKRWRDNNDNRILIILAGTKDDYTELNSLSSLDKSITDKLADLFIEGGVENVSKILSIILSLLNNKTIENADLKLNILKDPLKWDWKDEDYPKIGVLYYKSLFRASDLDFPQAVNLKLRENNLSPKSVFVSSLKDQYLLDKVIEIFRDEEVDVILSTTSFACIKGSVTDVNPFDILNIPIIQMITSTNRRKNWLDNPRGLNSLDLSLQVVLPEIDGKIITRPCAFRENSSIDKSLETNITKLVPSTEGIEWIVNYLRKTLDLKYIPNKFKKISIILANYPVKNGRIANGVGLDTPKSCHLILNWLKDEDYFTGNENLPINSKELVSLLLSHRTNDRESLNNSPLTYLPLKEYLLWWDTLSTNSKNIISNTWGQPHLALDLEKEGFPILGVRFGNVNVLIQPSRSYEKLNSDLVHSPDLPPPHSYLAQYLWIKNVNKTNAIINLGKHGTVEWLPGKGVGLSSECHTSLALDYLPNIYPFIVNDPGEGSQAKRRSHSIILDHLTPPLDRANLYGELAILEGLIDEYYEANLVESNRTEVLEEKILDLISKNNMSTEFLNPLSTNKLDNSTINQIDSYLCELKELQIRTGLHTFGEKLSSENLISLILCIIRSPNGIRLGFTQQLAKTLNLGLDPWLDDQTNILTENDIFILSKFMHKPPNTIRNVIDWLESQAFNLLSYKLTDLNYNNIKKRNICSKFLNWSNSIKGQEYFNYVYKNIYSKLIESPYLEKESLINSLSSRRIKAGPSGAPSRGRPEVLPTGRNFYSLDLRGLPTEAAWDMGRKAAENVIDLYLQEHGEDLTHLALSVWGTSTMRNGGEDICQLLALIGVRPVWDGPTRRFVDLEIIPLSVLNRPRVDVTLRISGLFRDGFPNLINCVYRAQKLIRNLDEPAELNPYANNFKKGKTPHRIYGSSPNSYGAGLQTLIDSGNWESKSDLAKAYLSWSKWSYQEEGEAKEDLEAFSECLKNVQVVIHNQDNREHDLLDSDDYYQFHGGLSAAVEYKSDKKPSIYFGDNSRIGKPRVHKLETEIDKVVRSRVLNPKWIEGMKKHGFKGGFEMSATLDYLFAYDATTDIVKDWIYSEITDKWLTNKETLKFLLNDNPWVLRDIAERLLEASKRNMWKSIDENQRKLLNQIILKSEFEIEKNT